MGAALDQAQRAHRLGAIAHCLETLGFDFVSVDPSASVNVVAAKTGGRKHFTLGIALQPSADQITNVLTHAFETIGCDALMVLMHGETVLAGLSHPSSSVPPKTPNQICTQAVPCIQAP
jgi:hypothetical protein